MIDEDLRRRRSKKGERKEKEKMYKVSNTDFASSNDGGIAFHLISKLDNGRGKGRKIFDGLNLLRSIADHSGLNQQVRILGEENFLRASVEEKNEMLSNTSSEMFYREYKGVGMHEGGWGTEY